MKIPDADPFHGDAAKIRTRLQQCENKFTEFPEATDTQKIMYAGNTMKGAAGSWMLPLLESKFFSYWTTFTKAIKTAFGESDSREATRQQIRAVCQTGTVNDYWTKFSTDMDLLKWNNEALLDEFYEGLHPRIRDRLANIIDEPKTLRLFVQECIKLDNELNLSKNRQTKFDLRNHTTTTRPRTHPAPPAWISPRNHNGTFAPAAASNQELPAGDPMKLDTSRKPRFLKLTDEEKTGRRNNHLCLYCGKKNHIADNCPEKRQGGQSQYNRQPAGIAATTYDDNIYESGNESDQE